MGSSYFKPARRLIDPALIRNVVLEQDPTLSLGDDVEPRLSIIDVRPHMSKTPRVEGLLAKCCTPVQRLAVTWVILHNQDPKVVARDFTRLSGEMVHPEDVVMAAEIGLENLRAAHVCGV
ncbi:MAG: hypothetical protein RL292_452 [Candidatus Parcubacteria bacterium]|jgi:hypothetical protein